MYIFFKRQIKYNLFIPNNVLVAIKSNKWQFLFAIQKIWIYVNSLLGLLTLKKKIPTTILTALLNFINASDLSQIPII